MSKLVIFRIERGSYEQGFPVRLEIRENGRLCAPEASGTLNPAAEIPKLYRAWQKAYYEWGTACRWFRRNPLETPDSATDLTRGIEVPPHIETHYASDDRTRNLEDTADALETALNEWLDRSSLEAVKDELLHTVNYRDRARFIFQTDKNNPELQQLPWELWKFIKERYQYPEVALSVRKVPKKGNFGNPVKILVILGSDENIDVQIDWNIVQNTLPRASLEKLEKPGATEFKEKLRSQVWDIIFFSGHTSTNHDGDDGRIWLNETEYLSPRQLEQTLEASVRRGLKLAIFNSCDGLGLARQLERLQIPHIIVMREPIHDRVAQKFLKDLLDSFAAGNSLHEALQEARDNLKLLENDSPKASWLPVLFTNPEEESLFYRAKNPDRRSWIIKSSKAIALILLGLILGLVLHQVLFPPIPPTSANADASLETGISLGEEILFEKNSNSYTEIGIKKFADGDYVEARKAFKKSLDFNPNQPEIRIYYNNAFAATYTGYLLKVASSIPIGTNEEIAEEILRGVALAQQQINDDGGINGRLLQVVIANDNNDGELAKQRATSFVKDNTILAVIGHNASGASLPAKNIYQANSLVAISPTSFTDELQGQSYIFKMVPDMILLASSLANFVRDNSPNKQNINVALCVDKAEEQQTFKEKFWAAILPPGTSGKPIPDIPLCSLDKNKFEPQSVGKYIAENNPNKIDFLLVAFHIDRISEGVKVYQSVRQAKLPLQLLGSPSFHTDKTIKEGGSHVEEMILPTPWFPKVKGKYQKDVEKLFNENAGSWRTAMSYDATQVIRTALETVFSKSEDLTSIRQKLDRILRDNTFQHDGITGMIKFAPNTGKRDFTQMPDRSDAIIQIKNSQFVRLE